MAENFVEIFSGAANLHTRLMPQNEWVDRGGGFLLFVRYFHFDIVVSRGTLVRARQARPKICLIWLNRRNEEGLCCLHMTSPEGVIILNTAWDATVNKVYFCEFRVFQSYPSAA